MRNDHHVGHPQSQATSSPRVRRRTAKRRRHRIQESRQARHRRRLSELCQRLRGLEGEGARHRRQRADALFHRAYAPPARSRKQPAALRQRMQFWRRIGRQQWAKTALGVVAAEYVRFVGKTTRLTVEPPDAWDRAEADMPIITAFWHGQHLLATNASKPSYRVKMLVSRHHDGEVNAIAAERLGVGTIRGSRHHAGGFVHKGGVAPFPSMPDPPPQRYSVALPPPLPKL